VSDASCFPEALDRPTVLTLIALSKRLAKHLLSKDKTKAATRKTTRKKKGADKPETPAAPPTDGSPAED